MTFLVDLFKGKAGLAQTYWLWGVLGGILVAAGNYAVSFAAVKNIDNLFVYYSSIYGYSIFTILWTLFISIAIINSASYNRKRGVWGWIASILATFGILKAILATGTLLGLMPMTWSDFEQSISIENIGLPVQIGAGLTLTNMSTNSNDKSLTYHYKFDYETLNSETFDSQLAKEGLLEACGDYESFLGGTAKEVIFQYEANDGTVVNIKILPEDCGF